MAAVGFLSPARVLFVYAHGYRRRHSRGNSPSSTPPAMHLVFPPRCSGEASPELVAAEDGAPSPASEIPVGTPKKTPSLISAANVQKAIRGIEITNVDHYGRLGIARGDSYDKGAFGEDSPGRSCSENLAFSTDAGVSWFWRDAVFSGAAKQKREENCAPKRTLSHVNGAYQKMCEEVISQGLDEEEANKRLDLLKESYGILSSEEERRLYDWSLARNEMPDRYVWPFEVDITQTPTQPPPPPEPEDVGPTRLAICRTRGTKPRHNRS